MLWVILPVLVLTWLGSLAADRQIPAWQRLHNDRSPDGK